MRYLERSDGFEGFLDQLNAATRSITEPTLSQVPPSSAQIVGLPRSGTTVLYQLLARTGTVGYPSNVMAFFHRNPWVGAMLQERLAANGPTLSLNSVAGRTPEPLDPHEFGYFWRRVCGHSSNSLSQDRDPLPPGQLQRELDLVAAVFERTVVYKNFLALAHATTMRHDMDRMLFISVERDRLDAAASLLHVRRRLEVPDDQVFGTAPESLRPDVGDPVTTVARQIVALRQQQENCRFDAAGDSMVIQYADLIRHPRAVVSDVLDFLGAPTDRVGTVIPEELSPGAGAAGLSADVLKDLRAALDHEDRTGPLGPAPLDVTERTS